MPWKPGHNLGFAPATHAVPWLPVGAPAEGTVDEQAAEILSPLHLTKALIALRKDRNDLRLGPYQRLPAPPGVWAYRRGFNTAVGLNLTGEIVEFEVGPGQILLGTRRGRDGDPLDDGRLRLRAWEGAVLELDLD
jgi:alpha-glucosidase